MTPRRRAAQLAGLAAGLSVVGWPAEAPAEDAAYRVIYRAPESCPDEAAFTAEVKSRTKRARLAEPGEIARTLEVSVETHADASLARVEFTDADARRVVREVSGETCTEVVSGIALVTALAIDARAEQDEKAAATKPPPPAALPKIAPPPPIAEAPRPTPRSDEGSPLHWDLGLGLFATSAAAPELLFGIAAYLGAGSRAGGWATRLSLGYSESPVIERGGGEARFRLLWARAEGCPFALRASERLAVVPCAAFDAGMLIGSGQPSSRIVAPKTQREHWLAASAVGRVELLVSDGVLVEAQGEIGLPFSQHRFVFEQPDAEVHDVPAVRFGFGASMGFRFQ